MVYIENMKNKTNTTINKWPNSEDFPSNAELKKYVATANEAAQAELQATDEAEAKAWGSSKTLRKALGNDASTQYEDNTYGSGEGPKEFFTEFPATSELLARIKGREESVRAAGQVAVGEIVNIPVEEVSTGEHTILVNTETALSA